MMSEGKLKAMASKKKSASKKHKFKATNIAPEMLDGAISGKAAAGVVGGSAATRENSYEFAYVSGDLFRIAVSAVLLAAMQLALWYLFSHTGMGSSVYGFFSPQ